MKQAGEMDNVKVKKIVIRTNNFFSSLLLWVRSKESRRRRPYIQVLKTKNNYFSLKVIVKSCFYLRSHLDDLTTSQPLVLQKRFNPALNKC